MADMRYFCTYFDRNYLVKGLSLIHSLARWHNNNFKIFVVCMDEFTRVVLDSLHEACIVTIPLHSIEEGDYLLLNCRHDRTHVEYLWTSTPTIILRVLERNPEVDILTYLDADMFCYGPTDVIYQEFGEASVMIHEHRFPQFLQHLACHGIYNVGLLIFRRDANSFMVLNWWRERCIEWCKSVAENDRFGDQKYLDRWPNEFSGVKVTQNIGVGTAPWNHSQYIFRQRDNQFFVNETQLLIYHYHAFYILNEAVVVPCGNSAYRNPRSYFQTSLLVYLNQIDASISLLKSLFPDFNFGLEKTDFSLTPDLALLIKTDSLEYFRDAGLPEERSELGSGWTFFPGATTI